MGVESDQRTRSLDIDTVATLLKAKGVDQLPKQTLSDLDIVAVEDILSGDGDLDPDTVTLGEETKIEDQLIEDVVGDFDGVAVQDVLERDGDVGRDTVALSVLGND